MNLYHTNNSTAKLHTYNKGVHIGVYLVGGAGGGGYAIFRVVYHRVSVERKWPYKKKLKGAWVFPLYFDNNDVTYK